MKCLISIVAPIGCGDQIIQTIEPTAAEKAGDEAVVFWDVSKSVGLDHSHFNGMSGELYFVEPVGPGAALFDYDNDGDLDVYFVQGGMLPRDLPLEEAYVQVANTSLPLRDRLFRNDLTAHPDGSRTLAFTDVTNESGLDARGYGMGVSIGDFDNDGWADLFVTNFGPNQLWRNSGDGTFKDVTPQAEGQKDLWSTSSSWFDYDRDGWLDLYIAQYVDFRIANHKTCRNSAGRPDYCGPQSYPGRPDSLLHNLGDGTFEDVSAEAGLVVHPSSGLGVITDDFNADGWVDIYVANDLRRNFLWLNQKNGHFVDRALITGVAVSSEGRAEASMGVVVGDLDNDQDHDIFLTHLRDGTNTLYLQDGQGQFNDQSRQSGLGMPSLAFTGFGVASLDYDNDGWLDILTANGSVFQLEELILAGNPYPLGQRNQLFHNLGDGNFIEVIDQAGAAFSLLEVSRGLSIGDIDNDGDTDALILNNQGPARLLLNQVGQDHPWVGIRVLTTSGRDALGARTVLKRRNGPDLLRRAHTDGSYCSANDPRVLFGLAAGGDIDSVEVLWPSGSSELFTDIEIGRYQTLIEGTGTTIEIETRSGP